MNKPENVINKTPIDKLFSVKTSEAHIKPTIPPTGYSGSLYSEGQLGIGPLTLCFPFLCLMPQLLFVPAACYICQQKPTMKFRPLGALDVYKFIDEVGMTTFRSMFL